MSGTSADGVDAALVEIDQQNLKLIGAVNCAYPASVREKILQLNIDPVLDIADLCELEHQVSISFIEATQNLLNKHSVDEQNIIAVGSHGQTVFHNPTSHLATARAATTMQLGNSGLIAVTLGIDTIGDFRRADMAAGGQGAPLMPAFHHAMFGDKELRFVLNLGGIANITVLGSDNVIGFDTGPANTLLDAWSNRHLSKPYDEGGQWARQGHIDNTLLQSMLSDNYFKQSPPKSTGTDYFNLSWLQQFLSLTNHDKGNHGKGDGAKGNSSKDNDGEDYRAENIQATLMELSVHTIAESILACTHNALKQTHAALHKPDQSIEVLVCGGGAHNAYLVEQLEQKLPEHSVLPTTAHGIDGDYCEAMGFAWLAYRHLQKLPGNLPSVTGARNEVVLGGSYVGRPDRH